MLTRDIELNDAILDLVDNCVDGAMRQRKGKLDEPMPFKGFQANLVLSQNHFHVSDNCGGIPKDYIDDAFSLGRPNIKKDGDLPTIGMYGIGMKRAIFKIGNSASVQSNSSDGFFEVKYTSEWLDPENDKWDLPISRSNGKDDNLGVTIDVDNVKPDIGRQFENEAFINALKNEISEHFGYLMQRGFSITVNKEPLKPKTLILFNAAHSDDSDIRAFDFEAIHDEVSIKVTIGLFRGLAKEAEIDDETDSPKEKETAGISVVCNDRVILLSDRTLKSGWGDGTVPRYHPQFRAIAGLIIFSSNNAEKLPISTTKRGLDVGSEIYLLARKATMEGLKTFTDFTNKWKGMEDETAAYFEPAKRADVKTTISLAKAYGISVRGVDGAKKYIPKLPLPANKNPRRRVSFVRDDQSIRQISKYLFDDSSQHPSIVGGECFDRVLAEATKK
ncbi:ATP-binding protein [Bosea sp. LjRoot90]|uniref:ATP-binding protein n=1 Tax=Bosea sp. LjRoot90 TaxID=3342342 RepID=UPI003ECE3988